MPRATAPVPPSAAALLEQLSANVAALRAAGNWSTRALAQHCGVSRDFIQRLERGAYSTVSLDTVERLAKGLGVRTSSLLGVKPTPREESDVPTLQALAGNLARARTRRNWTLKELGKHSGCNMYAISHLERQDRAPTLSTLAKLAEALDATAEELLSGQ